MDKNTDNIVLSCLLLNTQALKWEGMAKCYPLLRLLWLDIQVDLKCDFCTRVCLNL